MQLIEHYEVPSGGVSSIVFDEIPQTFTDLYLVFSLRGSQSFADDNVKIAINGSSANLTRRQLAGNGSSPSTTSGAPERIGGYPANTATANTFGNGSSYFPNYTSSNYKSFSTDAVSENNATLGLQTINAHLWSVTDPITSITLSDDDGGNLLQYSSATLYGILAGSSGGVTVS
jgi:hypothetical protein